jgi:hypothetical protein
VLTIDCAEHYKDHAVAEEVAFSLIATDTLYLLDHDVLSGILRRGRAKRESTSVKQPTARKR